MSNTNAHKSPSTRALGSSIALAIALVATPALAADEPAPTAAPAKKQATPKPAPKSQSKKPSAKKPRASRRTLDATARRALRASSKASDSIDGERVAMRTVAPAADEGDPPKRRKSKKKPSKDADEERASSDASDRRISLDEDFLVEGKLEKPNAFYILRRSQSGYDWARLDAKFLPLVLESVQDPLF